MEFFKQIKEYEATLQGLDKIKRSFKSSTTLRTKKVAYCLSLFGVLFFSSLYDFFIESSLIFITFNYFIFLNAGLIPFFINFPNNNEKNENLVLILLYFLISLIISFVFSAFSNILASSLMEYTDIGKHIWAVVFGLVITTISSLLFFIFLRNTHVNFNKLEHNKLKKKKEILEKEIEKKITTPENLRYYELLSLEYKFNYSAKLLLSKRKSLVKKLGFKNLIDYERKMIEKNLNRNKIENS